MVVACNAHHFHGVKHWKRLLNYISVMATGVLLSCLRNGMKSLGDSRINEGGCATLGAQALD